MPKRGSSTSTNTIVVPRKKQKNTQSNDEEHDENTPLNHSSYSSQLFKKSPDVKSILSFINYRQISFVLCFLVT